MKATLAFDDPRLIVFMNTRHLATLTTLRPGGTPHVVPVGVSYDPASRTARLITRDGSVKARNIEAYANGAPVAIAHVDGGYWVTLEGTARISRDPAEITESVRRYEQRYRPVSERPARITIIVDVTRVMGRLP